MNRHVLFLTGTRADFGKIKPLIQQVDASDGFEASVFVTGMHTLYRYGYTVDEVYRSIGERRIAKGFRNIHTFMNQVHGDPMERILGNTILGLACYVHELEPDMIVVHGDRVEALAGATVGALRNIRVAHIEGGELSGTVDEIIRHAVSKLAHIHFVANDEAASRLHQMGERSDSVFVIGSPDIDIMLSDDLPDIDEVKRYYEIPFDGYATCLFHPVTTDIEGTDLGAKALVEVLLADDRNYVVIYPNNDEGSARIFAEYERLQGNPRFVFYPSMRVESFLTLLKNTSFLIGNSSAGVRETPVYGVPSVNIVGRQRNRFRHASIFDVEGTVAAISAALASMGPGDRFEPSYHFGQGDSARLFGEALENPTLWAIPKQKQFVDVPDRDSTDLETE